MEGELLKGEETRVENGSPHKKRLRTKEAAQDIFSRGGKCVTASFVLFILKNTEGESFHAIYAGKKLGGAVERNRVKRIFREAIRLRSDTFRGYDFIVIPRKESITLSSRQVADHLDKALFQLDLLK